MSREDKYIMSNELKAPKQVVTLSANTAAEPFQKSHAAGDTEATSSCRQSPDAPSTRKRGV